MGIYLSHGDGTLQLNGFAQGTGLSGAGKSASVGDFNGDGLGDVMVYGDSGCQIFQGTAIGGFTANACPNNRSWSSSDRFFLADFAWKGRSDLFVYRANVSPPGRILFLSENTFPDL